MDFRIFNVRTRSFCTCMQHRGPWFISHPTMFVKQIVDLAQIKQQSVAHNCHPHVVTTLDHLQKLCCGLGKLLPPVTTPHPPTSLPPTPPPTPAEVADSTTNFSNNHNAKLTVFFHFIICLSLEKGACPKSYLHCCIV